MGSYARSRTRCLCIYKQYFFTSATLLLNTLAKCLKITAGVPEQKKYHCTYKWSHLAGLGRRRLLLHSPLDPLDIADMGSWTFAGVTLDPGLPGHSWLVQVEVRRAACLHVVIVQATEEEHNEMVPVGTHLVEDKGIPTEPLKNSFGPRCVDVLDPKFETTNVQVAILAGGNVFISVPLVDGPILDLPELVDCLTSGTASFPTTPVP